jgi:hypothetical protein
VSDEGLIVAGEADRHDGLMRRPDHLAKGERTMKSRVVRSCFAVGGFALIGLAGAPVASAQQCPDELAQLNSKIAAMSTQTVPRTLAGTRQDVSEAPRGQNVQAPRGPDVQAPRSDVSEAPRGQNVQAPRSDVSEAPRGQNVQAPRSDVSEAPRGQNVQAPRSDVSEAPRGQNVQAPRSAAGARTEDTASAKLARARALAAEAETACKAGNMTLSQEKAKAALATLN